MLYPFKQVYCSRGGCKTMWKPVVDRRKYRKNMRNKYTGGIMRLEVKSVVGLFQCTFWINSSLSLQTNRLTHTCMCTHDDAVTKSSMLTFLCSFTQMKTSQKSWKTGQCMLTPYCDTTSSTYHTSLLFSSLKYGFFWSSHNYFPHLKAHIHAHCLHYDVHCHLEKSNT